MWKFFDPLHTSTRKMNFSSAYVQPLFTLKSLKYTILTDSLSPHLYTIYTSNSRTSYSKLAGRNTESFYTGNYSLQNIYITIFQVMFYKAGFTAPICCL